MTDLDDTEPNADELERDAEDEQADRAPQPGNTPAPDEPPLDSGAITGDDLADDH